MLSVTSSAKYIAPVAISIALLSSTSAIAAVVNVPKSVDSGQAAKRFDAQKAPLSAPDLDLPIPSDVGELSAEAKKQLEKSQFELKSVEVDGSTIYDSSKLDFAFKDKIGQKISLLDAREIAKKITDLYRNDGYILSQAVVPAQDLKNGVLKIRVIEGFVGSVVIEGEKITDSQRKVLQGFANKINSSKPIKTQDLERYLLLMNDLPGAQVSGLLRPSSKFGAADLVLKVGDEAFEGSYNVDNRGSKFIGPWQHSVTGTANSLLGMYDKTQLRVSTTSQTSELRSFELQHSHQLDSEGTELNLLVSRTRTNPGDSLKVLDIIGKSDMYKASLSHPFIRSRKENLVGRSSFELNNTDTNVFNDIDFTEDRLRVGRLGANYNLFDSLNGNNLFDLQISQGFNFFKASDSGTNRSNAIGESDFTKINFDLSRLQTLTDSVSLLASASSQYSFDPLLVAEQFSLGGAGYGQAYDPAEVLGDSGIAGKLELRYDNSIGAEYLQDYQVYTFYDVGKAWLRNVPDASNDKKSLASAGVGIRLNFNDNLFGDLQVAAPLTRTPSSQSDDKNNPRIFANFLARF